MFASHWSRAVALPSKNLHWISQFLLKKVISVPKVSSCNLLHLLASSWSTFGVIRSVHNKWIKTNNKGRISFYTCTNAWITLIPVASSQFLSSTSLVPINWTKNSWFVTWNFLLYHMSEIQSSKMKRKLEVLRDSLGMKCFATAPARQQQASTFCTLGWLKGLGQWKDMKKFVGALDREASRST